MFLLIDNYDSFTYNLVQAFMQIGLFPKVIQNDDPALLDYATAPDLSMVCISPGPSNPQNAGLCLEFLKKLSPDIPCLGVCLGHQILGHFSGAEVVMAQEPVHGKTSHIVHNSEGLFFGISSPMLVGRYHSLIVSQHNKPDNLDITAQTKEGEIMALRYKDRPWVGVQFHPESILTEDGVHLLQNFASGLLTSNTKARPQTEEPVKNTAATPISHIIEALIQGENLTKREAQDTFTRLMEGELSPSQAAAFLLGLRIKGETPVEFEAAVRAVLAKAVVIPPIAGPYIDIVGTGGDSKHSFNCSTATALTLAGMGYKVLKHGNRSVSSSSGSADVLEKLGIPLDIKPEAIPALLTEQGFAFLFAPNYHPSFRHVMPVRREMGVRTLFNILGPLVNPAHPTHSMLGVANKKQLSLIAETLARTKPDALGAVVLGARDYDELTTFGTADVMFVAQGKTWSATLNPEEFGFSPCREEDLVVHTPEESAQVLRELLSGQGPEAMRAMLTLNVGMGIYILEYLDQVVGTHNPTKAIDGSRMAQAMQKAKTAVQNGAGKRLVN